MQRKVKERLIRLRRKLGAFLTTFKDTPPNVSDFKRASELLAEVETITMEDESMIKVSILFKIPRCCGSNRLSCGFRIKTTRAHKQQECKILNVLRSLGDQAWEDDRYDLAARARNKTDNIIKSIADLAKKGDKEDRGEGAGTVDDNSETKEKENTDPIFLSTSEYGRAMVVTEDSDAKRENKLMALSNAFDYHEWVSHRVCLRVCLRYFHEFISDIFLKFRQIRIKLNVRISSGSGVRLLSQWASWRRWWKI